MGRADRASIMDAALNAEIAAIAEAEIESGYETGLQIVVYHRGRLLVEVCAGCASVGQPVTPETRFMTYSVTKGVASTVLAMEISAGRCQYSDQISQFWPGFSVHGKQQITIEEALSHRSGLRASSLMPLKLIWLVLCRNAITAGGGVCMRMGIEWLAQCVPTWRQPHARYHPTSWSWIAGGIYQHLRGEHIREGAKELTRRLRLSGNEIQIGEVDKARASIAPLRFPSRLTLPPLPTPSSDGLPLLLLPVLIFSALRWLARWMARWMLLAPAAYFEATVGVSIGNWSRFLALCLPSSNGIFTARALGAMYGALANGGALADGRTLISAELTEELRRRAADSSLDSPGLPSSGRLTCGFSPWLSEQIEAHRHARVAAAAAGDAQDDRPQRLVILGHPGMGGCCAYADLSNGISLAVLKSTFSPETINGTGAGRVCLLVDDAVCRWLARGGHKVPHSGWAPPTVSLAHRRKRSTSPPRRKA